MKMEKAIEMVEELLKADFLGEYQEAVEIILRAAENPLLAFVEKEVPFRLTEMFGDLNGEITDDICQDCTERLYEENDILFDYDRIDSFLLDVLAEYGIHQS